jgi:hypothetical protein
MLKTSAGGGETERTLGVRTGRLAQDEYNWSGGGPSLKDALS